MLIPILTELDALIKNCRRSETESQTSIRQSNALNCDVTA